MATQITQAVNPCVIPKQDKIMSQDTYPFGRVTQFFGNTGHIPVVYKYNDPCHFANSWM